LVGGGAWPRPGEITLAHRGVLFLDEFPEFEKRVIEALRQPLEDRIVTVSRARGSITFPASFILIAAMNPCPCGNKGLKQKECICSPAALARYQRKLSGPIIDRIDLWLEVGPVEHAKLRGEATGPRSAAVRQRVASARGRQVARFKQHGRPHRTNSEMGVRDLKRFAELADSSYDLLNQAAKKLDLSARAYHRVIKLARTIADLEGAENIKDEHILEALQYRPRAIYT
jgi:magnesium chelatase family protein